MSFLGLLIGVVITMVRKHRDTTNPRERGTDKPMETDLPGMTEARDQEPDLPAWQADLFRQIDDLAATVAAGGPGGPTEATGWRPTFRRHTREARFNVVSDGYAQDEVDSVIGQHERSFDNTRDQLKQTELSLAEADSRVQALEARVSELEEWGVGGSALPEMAGELLDKAQEIGREVRRYVLSQAEAETNEVKQATEPLDSTRARADEIVVKAHQDRDDIDRSVEESRRQIDQYLRESSAIPEQRSRVAWEKAQGHLRQPVLELVRLNQQRRAMLEELLELRELTDTAWRRVVRRPRPLRAGQ
jgi:hypothetical protein